MIQWFISILLAAFFFFCLQKLRHTESDRLAVQVHAYLDNMIDVAQLLEDSETKTDALEKVAELEDELSHVCSVSFPPSCCTAFCLFFFPMQVHSLRRSDSLIPCKSRIIQCGKWYVWNVFSSSVAVSTDHTIWAYRLFKLYSDLFGMMFYAGMMDRLFT